MLALLNQLAVSFDLPILDWIQAHLQCGFLDAVMPIVTLFGEGGIFWIAWAVLMLVFPKTRKTGIAMAIALIMGVLICNVTLKPLIGRPRPYDYQLEHFGVTIKLLIDAQHDYSFPSGHTATAFMGAEFLRKEYWDVSPWIGVAGYAVAAGTGFFRMYNNRHWLTDVLTGAGIGILSTQAAYWLYPTITKTFFRKRYKNIFISPYFSKEEKGVSCHIAF